MTHRSGKRSSQRNFEQMMGGAGTCSTCGKTRYLTKPAAKKAIRQMPSRTNRICAYPCGDFWHIGQPPKKLVTGEIRRSQVVPTKPREPFSWRAKDERKPS